MEYLQTGYMPGQSSSSSSSSLTSGWSNTKGATANQYMNAPFITRDYAPLATAQRDFLFGEFQRGGLPEGYVNEGLRGIGQTNSINARSLEQDLTSRGLGRMTAAGQDVLQGNAANASASFLNQVPTLAQDNMYRTVAAAQGAIGQFGTGQAGTSSGTSNSTTNSRSQTDSSSGSSSSGGMDYGGIGSLLSSLMPYYTSGRQGGLLSYLPSLLSFIPGLGGGSSKKTTSNPANYLASGNDWGGW